MQIVLPIPAGSAVSFAVIVDAELAVSFANIFDVEIAVSFATQILLTHRLFA